MNGNTLLLIDDDQDLRESIAVYLSDSGFSLIEAADGKAGLELFYRERPDVVITDLRMPVLDGFEVIRDVAANSPDTPVLVISGTGEIKDAIRAMRLGARDYVVKPICDMEELELNIRRLLQESSLRKEVDSLKDKILNASLKHPQAFAEIITRHPAMLSLFRYLEVVAATSQPILISGETGTGKELFARAVHAVSGRKGRLICVNVAGLDDTMFSDTLFGHVRGAFTGADHTREGLIAQAKDGTLFLDEIGDLKEASQIKLLRLLQEGDYFPQGSDYPKRANCRIVVATHRDLPALLKSGEFRQDLYYRLYAHQMQIPPLRERKEDIPLLLEQFLQEASQELNKKKPYPPPELCDYLSTYSFPGNVRELRAMVFEALARHASGVLSMDSFLSSIGRHEPEQIADIERPLSLLGGAVDGTLPTLKQAEALLIKRAMQLAGGNQGVAARYLGINRSALNKKLNKERNPAVD